jgi:acetylornithine deacetylase/succinyl-diaminopimelate desuccinylase-like protein
VVAQEASSIRGASNQVLPRARAIVSCRIVPDQDPDEVFAQLEAVLSADPPWGVQVSVQPHGQVNRATSSQGRGHPNAQHRRSGGPASGGRSPGPVARHLECRWRRLHPVFTFG